MNAFESDSIIRRWRTSSNVPRDLRADALGRRIGRDEDRKRGLQGDESTEELVVLGVGHDRRVSAVVRRVGVLDLPRERGVLAWRPSASGSAAISATSAGSTGRSTSTSVIKRRIRKGTSPAIRHNHPVAASEVTTARLRLRGWRDSDRDAFAAMNADPIVMEHFPAALDRPASDAMIDRMRAHWRVDGFGLWAIEALDDLALLGFAGLARPTFEAHFTPAVEVGWRLAHHAWGYGYATEAAREALRFGFETVGLEEIVSFTVPGEHPIRRRDGTHRHDAESG